MYFSQVINPCHGLVKFLCNMRNDSCNAYLTKQFEIASIMTLMGRLERSHFIEKRTGTAFLSQYDAFKTLAPSVLEHESGKARLAG